MLLFSRLYSNSRTENVQRCGARTCGKAHPCRAQAAFRRVRVDLDSALASQSIASCRYASGITLAYLSTIAVVLHPPPPAIEQRPGDPQFAADGADVADDLARAR